MSTMPTMPWRARLGALALAGCDTPALPIAEPAPSVVAVASAVQASASSSASSSGAPASAAPQRFEKRQRTLDCGNYFGCAIVEQRLACWGYNQFGQLGSGKLAYPAKGRAFVAVPSPVAVAVGFTHGCALTSSGEVHCWGAPSGGAVGDGVLDSPDRPTKRIVAPTKVLGLDAKVIDLDVDSQHSCAVLEDGGVACWGDSYADVLGAGVPSSAKPVRIAGVQGAVEVATSSELSCVRSLSGEVTCWGRGGAAPSRVAGACARQLAIASGGVCEIDCAGTVSCWGSLPGFNNSPPTPKVQPGFADVEEIRGGLAHFIARDRSGRVITWGGNDSGQIGNGKPASWTEAHADDPVALATPRQASAVCAGGITARPDGRAYLRPASFVDTGSSCAATATGEVYCWGEPDLDYVPKRVVLPK